MRNKNTIIVGQPGAGKTTLALELVKRTRRVFIFDPVADYEPDGWTGDVIEGRPSAALRYMAERWDEDFRLVYRPGAEPELEAELLATMIEQVQQQQPEAGPLAVFLEEASHVSETQSIPRPIKRLYNLGRRWRINIVAVIQVDTDIHRVFRRASHLWVTMRQQQLSGSMAARFDRNQVAELEELRRGRQPVKGRHYLVSPDVDLLAVWDEHNRLSIGG